mmetsp:Transcript_36260/g.73718  ORF Transcript_36260/g.73718 Transcript_36260/m.73718 type:complete len:87 (+) Transcript_36260:509-769(+)
MHVCRLDIAFPHHLMDCTPNGVAERGMSISSFFVPIRIFSFSNILLANAPRHIYFQTDILTISNKRPPRPLVDDYCNQSTTPCRME